MIFFLTIIVWIQFILLRLDSKTFVHFSLFNVQRINVDDASADLGIARTIREDLPNAASRRLSHEVEVE